MALPAGPVNAAGAATGQRREMPIARHSVINQISEQ
jgi:hypothetical protein